jgi:hypothetical protein
LLRKAAYAGRFQSFPHLTPKYGVFLSLLGLFMAQQSQGFPNDFA